MSNIDYRYFFITRTGIKGEATIAIEEKYYQENGEYLKAESALMEKYNIVKYFVFKNHLRYLKACQKLQEDNPKNSLDMLAAFKSESCVPEGFTTIDLGDGKAKAAKELKGLNMFKIDLRTKTGKKVFDEFLALRGFAAGRELSLGDYVAENFGLLYKFVPGYDEENKELYQTIATKIEDGWLVAAPKCTYTDKNELKGLADDYVAEAPVTEISKEEYFSLAKGNAKKCVKKKVKKANSSGKIGCGQSNLFAGAA